MGYEVNSRLTITGFSNEEQKNLIYNELNKVIKRYNRHDEDSKMPEEDVYMNDGWSELNKKEWHAFLNSFWFITGTEKSRGEFDIRYYAYGRTNEKEVESLSSAYPNLNFYLSMASGEANFDWFSLCKDGKELHYTGQADIWYDLKIDEGGIMKLEKNGKGYIKKYEESNKPSIDSNVSTDPYLSELDDDEIPF